MNKIIPILLFITLILTGSAYLLYGPYDTFRNFLITTAMGTMNHQYLATTFYSDEEIDKVLNNNTLEETGESTNTDLISFQNSTIFLNKYEKEILTKDEGNDLYKLINIEEDGLRGYLVVIYDPSKITVATSKNIGTSGQMLDDIAQDNNAVIAMNASGFVDTNQKGNGGVAHGAVISNGTLISNEERLSVNGGIIGFDQDNKLVLSYMTGQEAIEAGIRDAVDFGPFLIVNGKASNMTGNGGWGVAPRSAIAQRQDGIVLFLVMDGRDYANGIPGADMTDLTEILLRYGAYNAANLDGGTSSGLVINGEFVNNPINGSGQKKTRAIPDAFIVTE